MVRGSRVVGAVSVTERARAGLRAELDVIANERAEQRRWLEYRVQAMRARLEVHVPIALADYLKMLGASMVGFSILAALIAYVTSVPTLSVLAVFGVLFAGQATAYKVKLAGNPNFRIRGCGCGASRADQTHAVLVSKESVTLGVPNSLWAGVLFVAVLLGVSLGAHGAAQLLAAAALLASAYFGYVMVVRLRSVCALCVNIAALNALLFVQLVAR